MSVRHLGFPFRVGADGHSAGAKHSQHVRELVEQTLFTSPGERVNRPEHGTGLLSLIFAGNGPELQQSVEYLVRAALQEQLADVLTVDAVEVDGDEGRLNISVGYRITSTGERDAVRLEHRR